MYQAARGIIILMLKLAGPLVAACLTLALAAAPSLAQTPAEPVTLYRHARLIDVEAGIARPETAIAVRGERILAVLPDGDAAARPELAGARQVDLAGRFVIPGLIDSHEHLATPPNQPQARANMRRDLYGGVTAVRDMADDLRAVGELAREARLAEIPGPDLYYAALMAGPSFFADPRTHAAARGATAGAVPWMQAITPATDLPLAVAMARGTSATAIKVYANLPGDEVARIVAEAHQQGVPVWAHSAVFPASPKEVIAAGADVVSHACYLAYQVAGVPDSYQHRRPIDPAPFAGGANPVMAELFAAMRAKGAILDATGRVYVEDEAQAASEGKGRKVLCAADLAATLTRQAWRAGVPISAGTDGLAEWNDPWPALYGELDFLAHRVGMPPADVLKAATIVGARAAGQAADMGTVREGKLANFAVLTANPLADIGAVRSITLTVKRGRAYRRADYQPITKDEFKDAP
jgi:imidazolonepropionase-like amidohydrolase